MTTPGKCSPKDNLLILWLIWPIKCCTSIDAHTTNKYVYMKTFAWCKMEVSFMCIYENLNVVYSRNFLHWNCPFGMLTDHAHAYLTAESFCLVQNGSFQPLYWHRENHIYYTLHLPHLWFFEGNPPSCTIFCKTS